MTPLTIGAESGLEDGYLTEAGDMSESSGCAFYGEFLEMGLALNI